jgi:hypothetical protein
MAADVGGTLLDIERNRIFSANETTFLIGHTCNSSATPSLAPKYLRHAREDVRLRAMCLMALRGLRHPVPTRAKQFRGRLKRPASAASLVLFARRRERFENAVQRHLREREKHPPVAHRVLVVPTTSGVSGS